MSSSTLSITVSNSFDGSTTAPSSTTLVKTAGNDQSYELKQSDGTTDLVDVGIIPLTVLADILPSNCNAIVALNVFSPAASVAVTVEVGVVNGGTFRALNTVTFNPASTPIDNTKHFLSNNDYAIRLVGGGAVGIIMQFMECGVTSTPVSLP